MTKSEIADDLKPLHHRLNDILTRAKHPHHHLSSEEILKMQEELHEVDEHYREAKFDVASEERGHAQVAGLLNEAHDVVRKLQLKEEAH